MIERSYDQRRHCWEWEELERQRILALWDLDAVTRKQEAIGQTKDNKPNKADVTYTHKQA